MKINLFFIGIILLVHLVDCSNYGQIDDLWSNNLRIISWILMSVWFYQLQKKKFDLKQALFLLSLLLPIIVSITSYLLLERLAIIVNIGVNAVILIIWIYYFHRMGAKISLRDSENNLQRIVPAFLIFPLLFYFFSLYQSLSGIYTIIVLLYVLIFSYTGILTVFLPIREERRLYVILGIVLLALANIMNGYHTFLEKLFWIYPVIRTIIIISKCMIIYGIANSDEKSLNLNQKITDVKI